MVGGSALIMSGLRAADWYGCSAQPTITLPLDQIAQAFSEDERGGAHLDDLDLSPSDKQIE